MLLLSVHAFGFIADGNQVDKDEDEEETDEIDHDAIYEDYLDAAAGLDEESEMALWEEYLREYPDSPHADKARERMKVLEESLYDIFDEPHERKRALELAQEAHGVLADEQTEDYRNKLLRRINRTLAGEN